jgi:hypothetical protein
VAINDVLTVIEMDWLPEIEWKVLLALAHIKNHKTGKTGDDHVRYYKLADLLTCLLLHSPTLNAGKIRFTVSQSQLAKLQGTSDKTIYTRLKRLETMTELDGLDEKQLQAGNAGGTKWAR